MKENPEKIPQILDKKAKEVYSNLENLAKKGSRCAVIEGYDELYGDDYHKVNGTDCTNPCGQFKLWAEKQNKLKKYGVKINFNFVTDDYVYDDMGYVLPDAPARFPGCHVGFNW